MPFNLHDFAAKLKKRRADLDLSPEALAEETGISVESLRAVEDAARPATAPLQRVQVQIRHKQGPPYGLPPIYSVLTLSSLAFRSGGGCILPLIAARSFLAPRNQKQNRRSRLPHFTKGCCS